MLSVQSLRDRLAQRYSQEVRFLCVFHTAGLARCPVTFLIRLEEEKEAREEEKREDSKNQMSFSCFRVSVFKIA